MKARTRLFCFLLVSIAAPASALAATTFEVGTLPGMTFRIDAPTFSYASPIAITYLNVAGTYPRNNTPAATVSFFFDSAGGGFQVFDPVDNNTIFADLSGEQMFALGAAGARFTSGVYSMFDSLGNAQVSVRVMADSLSGVPEPTSWLLMAAGVGALGGALRWRRAQAASMLHA